MTGYGRIWLLHPGRESEAIKWIAYGQVKQVFKGVIHDQPDVRYPTW
jgi:hypothetical protein